METAVNETAKAPVDGATLERIGEKVEKLGRVDRVFAWDRKQAAQVWAGADGHVLTAEELAADAEAEALERLPGDERPTLRRHHLVPGPDVKFCKNDKDHGRLIINGAGTSLLCGAHKGGAPCTYNLPVSI